MYEKTIFNFVVPVTNIVAYGYSIFKDHVTQITVYYNNGSIMTEEEAMTLADAYIAQVAG